MNGAQSREEAHREEASRGEEVRRGGENPCREEAQSLKEAPQRGRSRRRRQEEEEIEEERGDLQDLHLQGVVQAREVHKKPTITSREIQTVVRLVLLSELAKHAVSMSGT
ncbi:hypothetical protein ACFX13_048018 [Malus domestica]